MTERVEKLGIRAENLGADKAYGKGEFFVWLLARGVQPHIPVIDHRRGAKLTAVSLTIIFAMIRPRMSIIAPKVKRCVIGGCSAEISFSFSTLWSLYGAIFLNVHTYVRYS